MLDKVQLEKDLAEVFARCIKRNDPAVNRIKKAFAEAVQPSHNTAQPTIARRIELLLEEWDEYEPDQKAVLADILSELQQAGA